MEVSDYIMGGYNSGPYSFIGKTGRMTVNQCYGIDVRRFNREGVLRPGCSFIWSWTGRDKYSVEVTVLDSDKIRLSYVLNDGQTVEKIIRLGFSECNYGGRRKWFFCPGCSKRAAWIYLRGAQFKCRHCHDLSYYSCNESGNFNETSMRRVNKVLSKLKSTERCGFDILYHTPNRPRYMHRKTYRRLLDRYDRKRIEYAASVRARVESLGCNARGLIDLPDGF